MAASLARIIGTEKDRKNCPFYFRIGACRHGERCSRQHLRPAVSQTVMFPHMYQPTQSIPPIPTSESHSSNDFFRCLPDEEEFVDFYEDVLDELDQYGRVEDMVILQNMGEHMFGHTYVRFERESEAERAMKALKGRYYRGIVLQPEFSPVTDFNEAVCGMYKKGFCERGDYCNFMHTRPLPRDARKRLELSSRAPSFRERSLKRRRQDASDDSHSENASDSERESSEERRARIAAWNMERERTVQT